MSIVFLFSEQSIDYIDKNYESSNQLFKSEDVALDTLKTTYFNIVKNNSLTYVSHIDKSLLNNLHDFCLCDKDTGVVLEDEDLKNRINIEVYFLHINTFKNIIKKDLNKGLF